MERLRVSGVTLSPSIFEETCDVNL
jgi:hypothetical protein